MTEKDRATLVNALRAAAGVYETDRRTMVNANQTSLAEQFERQREDVERLAMMLEDREEL